METKRLTEWLGTAEGLVKTISALLVSAGALAAAVTGQLKSVFEILGLPDMARPVAGPTVTVAILVILILFILRGYRRYARESRLDQPDKFTLVATTPESLIGRDDDLQGLLRTTMQNRIVLLDGKLGCGKSALVSSGLVPKLQAGDSLLPVLIRDWGDDWVRGPLAATLGALYDVLTPEQRGRVEWTAAPDLAARPAALTANLTKQLNAVHEVLQRRPLIIADQFDDYQAQHRDKFLDGDGNWLAPEELAAGNLFWDLICRQMRDESLHLLAVTRADTASGLSCIRFLDNALTACRTLQKVDVEYLRPLLMGIAPAEATPPVVSNPDDGWHALRERLESDFRGRGAILMQQVRTVLLGLRQLPTLTPRAYRRADGMSGVETLVIARSLRSAGEVLGGGETGVRAARAMLNALVPSAGADKAQRQPFSKLVKVADSSPERVERALRTLQSEEIVRPAGDAPEGAWQLDHDYLARAVLAEMRQADRWGTALRDGFALYRAAEGSLRKRWAALLPITVQARVLWENWRGRLRYSEAASYALRSALKPTALLAFLTVIAWGSHGFYQDIVERSQAQAIVDRLDDTREDGKRAALDLWSAPANVRARAVSKLLDSPGRLRAAGTDWVISVVALDVGAANALAKDLRTQIARPDFDSGTRRALVQAVGRVAGRLKEGSEEVDALAKDLRTQIARPGLNSDTRQALRDAFGRVAGRLKEGGEAANALAKDLRTQITRPDLDFDTRVMLMDAFGRVAGRLKEGGEGANALAKDLRTQIAKPDLNSGTRRALVEAVGRVAGRLKEGGEEANALAKDLRTQIAKPDLDSGTRRALVEAVGRVAGRLKEGGEEANALAKDLRTQIAKPDLIDKPDLLGWETQRVLEAFGRIAERLEEGGEAANALAKDLRTQITRPDLDFDTRVMLMDAFGRVTGRLKEGGEAATALAKDLRTDIRRPDLDSARRLALIYAFGRVAERLKEGGEEVDALAKDLRTEIARPDLDSGMWLALMDAFGRVAGRFKEGSAEVAALAKDLRIEMARPDLDSRVRQAFLDAFGRVAGRLKEGGEEANALAKDLRTEMARPVSEATRQVLMEAVSLIAGRLKEGSEEANALAMNVGFQIIRPTFEPRVRQAAVDAVGRVAGRLKEGSEEVDALAKALRTQIARPALSSATRQALVKAVGRIAGRLKEGGAEAGALAKDLRTEMARPDLDSGTQLALVDALGLIGGKIIANRPNDVRRATNLLVSVAAPHREPSDSPAWPLLEQAAARTFNKDVVAMMEWAIQNYGIRPDSTRPESR